MACGVTKLSFVSSSSLVKNDSQYPNFDFLTDALNSEARALINSKVDLMVLPPYRRDGFENQGYSNLNGPRWPGVRKTDQLNWVPLGGVGKYLVKEDTLLSVLREGAPEVKGPDFEEFFKKYRYQRPVCDMADWLLKEGLASTTLDPPNTAVYVKVKPDGTKLQIIADASLRNKSIGIKPKNFVLFSPEYAKPVLREPGKTFFFTFDASNFYYAFVLPQWFQDNIPVILRIPDEDGGFRSLRCSRAAFGDKVSPVLTHQALSEMLGFPSTVYIKGIDPRPHPCPWLDEKKDVSGIYIDDMIEISKVLQAAEERYQYKREKIRERDIPVKQSSVNEGVLDCEFAGKRYSGKISAQFIGNTKKNSAKLVALAMRMVSGSRATADDIRSLIGSFAFGTCHHKRALPFLAVLSQRVTEGFKSVDLTAALRMDILISLQLALSPWSPESEIRWDGFKPKDPTVIVDASFKDKLVGIYLFSGKECWVGSFSIPIKFTDSQQTAELYGLFLALKRGWERFGTLFNVVADSASSISSTTNIKMSALPLVRNLLIRKVVRWGFMRVMRISLSWTDTKHNLADIPSREVFKPINEFQKSPVSEFSIYLEEAKSFFLSSQQYSQK
jgi:hypothetical protein